MAIRWRRIQAITTKLLGDSLVARPPVPIEDIAKNLDLKIIYQLYENNDISGFLYKSTRETIIGINKSNSNARNRFTIAHEIGHFFLHDHQFDNVHVDKGFHVKLRDDESSQGTNPEEVEANAFAAELLMPAKFLADDLATVHNLDIEDDRFIRTLAGDYMVSSLAMQFRLARLGYIRL